MPCSQTNAIQVRNSQILIAYHAYQAYHVYHYHLAVNPIPLNPPSLEGHPFQSG